MDDFHPSRDAALLYISLDGLYGPHGLVFTQYSEIFRTKRQLLSQEQGIFVCLKLLLTGEKNEALCPFAMVFQQVPVDHGPKECLQLLVAVSCSNKTLIHSLQAGWWGKMK